MCIKRSNTPSESYPLATTHSSRHPRQDQQRTVSVPSDVYTSSRGTTSSRARTHVPLPSAPVISNRNNQSAVYAMRSDGVSATVKRGFGNIFEGFRLYSSEGTYVGNFDFIRMGETRLLLNNTSPRVCGALPLFYYYRASHERSSMFTVDASGIFNPRVEDKLRTYGMILKNGSYIGDTHVVKMRALADLQAHNWQLT